MTARLQRLFASLMAPAALVTMGRALARDRTRSGRRIIHPPPTRRRPGRKPLPTLVGLISRAFLICAVFARGDRALADIVVGSTGAFATNFTPLAKAPAGAPSTAAAYSAVPNQGVNPNRLIGGTYTAPAMKPVPIAAVNIGNVNVPYKGQNYAGVGYTTPKLFNAAFQQNRVASQTITLNGQTNAWGQGVTTDTLLPGFWGNTNVASFGGSAVVVSKVPAAPPGIGIGMGTDPFSLPAGVYSFTTAIDQTASSLVPPSSSEPAPPVSLGGTFLLENQSPNGVASLEFGATASFLPSDQPLWDLKLDLLGDGTLSIQFTSAPQLTLASGTDVQSEILSDLNLSVPGQVTLNSAADYVPLFSATLDASDIPSSSFTVSDFTLAAASISVVPEPTTLVLAGIAVTTLVAGRAARRRFQGGGAGTNGRDGTSFEEKEDER